MRRAGTPIARAASTYSASRSDNTWPRVMRAIVSHEIAPISDARGTADYKRLLLRQLLFAHFMELFPERFKLKELI